MFRRLFALTVAAGLTAAAISAQPKPPSASPPTVYELQINGESFLVEGNQQTKLESKEHLGVRYEVAVRVAPTQRVRLNTVQFEYELPAKVELAGRRDDRSVRLVHELGISLLLRDLGRPLDAKAGQEALDNLQKAVTSTLHDARAVDVSISEPHERKFDRSAARGLTVRYRDAAGSAHVCALYVLTGPTFAATCVAEFLDSDSDDVLPLIRKTLDSVGPVEPSR